MERILKGIYNPEFREQSYAALRDRQADIAGGSKTLMFTAGNA